MLYSKQIERHVLSGLVKNPDIVADLDAVLSKGDFYYKIHETIFSVLKNSLLRGETIDHVLVSQKIKALGISFPDVTDIDGYIESICFAKPSKKASHEAALELKKLRIRRELNLALEEAKQYVNNCGAVSIDEIVSKTDAIYNSKVPSYTLEKSPTKIFKGIKELLIERADAPIEDIGFLTPYPEFNRLYGGLRSKNLYAVASRPGQGKSTWLAHLGMEVCRLNKIPVLYLDTEMATNEQKFRLAAATTDVPLWYLETGNWRKDSKYKEKVEASFDAFESAPDFFHFEAGNKNIEEIISIIRRWYLTHVGRGNPCLIIYDYIKMTTEKVSQNWAEHQVIGDKINKLKEIGVELNSPIFTAIQLNRSGENQNRRGGDIVDDSSAIAASDRLQWFASFVAIFRRKTLDEISVDGEEFGTHKLIPVKTRLQGKDVNNFRVDEKGSLHDIVARENEQHDLTQDSLDDNDGMLL